MTTPRRWNIFARELQDILATRSLKLTHLDDRAGIYPRKVARLRDSLKTPKSFPVLNPEEIEHVAKAFALTSDEVLRLRAAMLTTAIEEKLMDRIDQYDALHMAEQLLLVLIDALIRDSSFDILR